MLKVVVSTVTYDDGENNETQVQFYVGGQDIGGLNLDDEQTQIVLRVLSNGGADIHDLRDMRVQAPVTPP